MKRASISVIAAALSLGALAAGVSYTTPASAEVIVIPAEVIATQTPVYHEGHAVYWYNGYWHYRVNGAWTYYQAEPAYLHTWRMAPGHVVVWHHYR